MKFRAVMVDTAAMRDFMNTVNSLSKLAKECVIRIVERRVYFIISNEDAGPRKPFVWCELPVNFYFKQYNLTGVNEEHNEIYLAFATGMLARSLSALKQNARSLKIKLTNKQMPCLTLEIELASSEGIEARQLIHDVPVEVISRQHWEDYAEPRFNDFHVSIQMPNLKPIKNIVERMKTMSNALIMSANKYGRLTLKIKTNMVTLSAHFPELSVESFAVGHMPDDEEMEYESEESDLQTVSATIDIKKFLMFLTGMQVNNCKTTCSIVQSKMVKLALEQPGALSFQCFLTELSS
ncbi:hypothetical protein ILUMI_03174 [Ignelater luminosus]|uniref:Checkpoint protein n=1 Tax=Ignelater luminosus TaxID=2038154 RepID=A0A8K0DBA0_IGNLU|nr:hypothetical protein ILUMI_03174 [Ignelater luminosus]